MPEDASPLQAASCKPQYQAGSLPVWILGFPASEEALLGCSAESYAHSLHPHCACRGKSPSLKWSLEPQAA